VWGLEERGGGEARKKIVHLQIKVWQIGLCMEGDRYRDLVRSFSREEKLRREKERRM